MRPADVSNSTPLASLKDSRTPSSWQIVTLGISCAQGCAVTPTKTHTDLRHGFDRLRPSRFRKCSEPPTAIAAGSGHRGSWAQVTEQGPHSGWCSPAGVKTDGRTSARTGQPRISSAVSSSAARFPHVLCQGLRDNESGGFKLIRASNLKSLDLCVVCFMPAW